MRLDGGLMSGSYLTPRSELQSGSSVSATLKSFWLSQNTNFHLMQIKCYIWIHTVCISCVWHVMTWECLIQAHGFNNAWVRERERGRARTPTRSNCLRNKTEQTSSLRKSLQENKLVTRLTPLTVLLSKAENDNNNKKKSPLQISLCSCEVSPPFEMHIKKPAKATTYLVVDIGGQEKKRRFSLRELVSIVYTGPTKEDKPEARIHKIYICFFVFR